MTRLALVLSVVVLLGLTASMALADPPFSSSSGGHVKATMVGHYGHRGAYSSHYRGHHTYRSRYYGHYGHHGYYGYRSPAVIIRPYGGCPSAIYPPVYGRYGYPYNYRGSGVYYRGRGLGFSITF
jgi:hypothetical protein